MREIMVQNLTIVIRDLVDMIEDGYVSQIPSLEYRQFRVNLRTVGNKKYKVKDLEKKANRLYKIHCLQNRVIYCYFNQE